ncbi:MAG: TIGR03936 family radical SAM-associated protein [Dehalococcoidia bacterium]|nr:TIGR03936 family radical SAM-associated protein [Dehalococcoidia bacterium]
MQRLRITFARGKELKYISHLDLMRLWQRALRRADIPLAYSQGFSPHPRLSIAAPLAIGVTSSGELIDIFLKHRVSPHFFLKSLSNQLPPSIDISEVAEIGLGLPSLQSQVLYAEYEVCVDTDKEAKGVEASLRSLLAKDTLPWQHARDKEIRKYDLRSLIESIWLLDCNPPECTLGMRLRCDSKGTGRPEQVTLALGVANPPQSIHRTKLILAPQNKHSPHP